MSKEIEEKINAVEMCFLCRILRIGWTSYTINEEVLFHVDTERKLMKSIEKQQPQFLGNCIRKDGMEKLTLMGKIAGKRGRGRQRITLLQRIAERNGMSRIEPIQCTENSNEWHKLVTDVIRLGTRRRRHNQLQQKPHIQSHR